MLAVLKERQDGVVVQSGRGGRRCRTSRRSPVMALGAVGGWRAGLCAWGRGRRTACVPVSQTRKRVAAAPRRSGCAGAGAADIAVGVGRRGPDRARRCPGEHGGRWCRPPLPGGDCSARGAERAYRGRRGARAGRGLWAGLISRAGMPQASAQHFDPSFHPQDHARRARNDRTDIHGVNQKRADHGITGQDGLYSRSRCLEGTRFAIIRRSSSFNTGGSTTRPAHTLGQGAALRGPVRRELARSR